ncbi:unnamed protein product [Ceutorhynchus assimilis]|uniref:Uncharacterized protein n=1 Tax=Ceutorhynchus assimilis TaxID=467358 RepID=A0A9N9MI81_9CUCU|nr:unnamed protein product [Ceutorhynchus assimilis]
MPRHGSTAKSEFQSTSSIMESTNIIYKTMRTTPRPLVEHQDSDEKAKNAPPDSLKSQTYSHIPLPLKADLLKSSSFIKSARSSISRPVSSTASRISFCSENKHTLEIQFINKNKMFMQMKRELEEKLKPAVDLHKTLVQLKRKLKELGKLVTFEDIKWDPMNEYQKTLGRSEGDGSSPNELLQDLKDSLKQISKTMIDVCKSLLSRRAMIVEVLEKVANSELNLSDVTSKIDLVKNESQQLENSLQSIMKDQQNKINELVSKWETLLSSNRINVKSEELELQPQEHETLMRESKHVIHNLQQKLENRKVVYNKSLAEMNNNIRNLRDQIQQLEHDLECERKSTKEIKTRNSNNSKVTKTMKDKIIELENYKATAEVAKVEFERKNKILNEQLKNKEAQWNKEKEEMTKALNKHACDFSKITSEKADYKTNLKVIEAQKIDTERELHGKIEYLESQVETFCKESKENAKQRDEAREKCAAFETFIARMGLNNKETMQKVCDSLKEGNNEQAESLREEMAKDVEMRELKDKMSILERERFILLEEKKNLENTIHSTDIGREIAKQQKCLNKYKFLLEESENKFMQKCNEVSHLQSQMKHLKVRQEALEEQNSKCPTEELQRIVEEGRYKLEGLMKKTVENERTLEEYIIVLEKKDHQINNLENLLRYRDNVSNILKGVRDTVMYDKMSLTKYATELRQNLSYTVEESKMKEILIIDLTNKIELREKQLEKLEEEIEDLKANIVLGNDKRFILQKTIGEMEKELQDARARANQFVDNNFRSERKKCKPF